MTVAVDPSDLYTLVRCFYVAEVGGVRWSLAERECCDRLNRALFGVQWEFRSEHLSDG